MDFSLGDHGNIGIILSNSVSSMPALLEPQSEIRFRSQKYTLNKIILRLEGRMSREAYPEGGIAPKPFISSEQPLFFGPQYNRGS